MNKYIALLMSWILLAGLLSGCLPSSDPNLSTQPSTTVPTTAPTKPQTTTTAPTHPTTVPTQPENPGVELEGRILYQLICDAAAKNVEWPIVIKSMAELQEFANSDFGKTLQYISEVVALYDDAFFTEHTLILQGIYIRWADNAAYDVDSCVMKDGCYLFKIGDSKHAFAGPAMALYEILFIEVRDDVPKDAAICVELVVHADAELLYLDPEEDK